MNVSLPDAYEKKLPAQEGLSPFLTSSFFNMSSSPLVPWISTRSSMLDRAVLG